MTRKHGKRSRFALLRGVAPIAILLAMAVPGLPKGAEDAAKEASSSAEGSPASQPKELISTTSAFRVLRDGGFLMYPIAICSLVMLAFTFERMVSLRKRRVIPKPFVTRFLQQIREGQLDRAEALDLCAENGSPIAQVFSGGTRKWGRPAVEVEQAVLDAGERATNGLRSYLRVFSAVSTVAPLLGLLGTVAGMIQAFNAVANSDALGRPEVLAGGVAQALLTTAFGLFVAIPALLLYYVFVSRVDQLIMEIDSLGQELVHMISAEEIQQRGDEARTAKTRKPRREAATLEMPRTERHAA